MTNRKLTIKAGDLIPATFLGGPVALILAGALIHFTTAGVALAAGCSIGLAAGLALWAVLKRA